MSRSRVALETGTHSSWISRLLSELGHEAIVPHAGYIRLIGDSRLKDDKIDAQTLPRVAASIRGCCHQFSIAVLRRRLICR